MRPAFMWIQGALVLALGCADTRPAPPVEAVESDAPASEPALPSGELAAHMGEHFWAVADAHDAAIQGNVEGIREAARWLAEHEDPEGFPLAAGPYLDTLRVRSARTAEARDLATAALGLSTVAAACGSCHSALGMPLATVLDEEPDAGDDLRGSMGAHIRAADLMWEGLVAPSSAAWASGADLLASVQLDPEDVTGSGTEAQLVEDLLDRLLDIAAQGNSVGVEARPQVYGQLVATCGHCHRALGRGFDPGS